MHELGCDIMPSKSTNLSMQESIENKNEIAMQKIYKRIVQTVCIEIKDLQKGIA